MLCTLLLGNKKFLSPYPFKRKKNIYFAIELSFKGDFFLCVRARPYDSEKLHSSDAQCNTEESP